MRDVALLGTRLVVAAMTVAATTHRAKGPLNARGGFELPLTNLATAATLAAVGPGRFRVGPSLPRPLALAAGVGGALLAVGLVARMLTAASAAPATPANVAGQAESAGQPSTQATGPR
jgi:putative oxidoreductase